MCVFLCTWILSCWNRKTCLKWHFWNNPEVQSFSSVLLTTFPLSESSLTVTSPSSLIYFIPFLATGGRCASVQNDINMLKRTALHWAAGYSHSEVAEVSPRHKRQLPRQAWWDALRHRHGYQLHWSDYTATGGDMQGGDGKIEIFWQQETELRKQKQEGTKTVNKMWYARKTDKGRGV